MYLFKIKRASVYIIWVSLILFLSGCNQQQNNRFTFVETKDGLSVYLDGRAGSVIYIDETNRIIDHVSLRPNSGEIGIIESSKREALRSTDRGYRDIPGSPYSVELSTRFYSNRLLYVIRLEPFDNRAREMANTISIQLLDDNGFVLGTINRNTNWVTSVNSEGVEVGLNTQGSIPITLRNYLEINRWGPQWQTLR